MSPLRSDDGSDILSSKSPVAAALAKGVNFRDISQNVECIKPGVVYRSSQVVSTTELAALKIQTVVDLRQAPVLCKAQHRNFWQSLRRAWMHVVTKCWCATGGRAPQGSGDSSVSSKSSASSTSLANPNTPRGEHQAQNALLPTRERYSRHIKHAVPCWRCTAACNEHYGVEATVYHVDLLPPAVSFHILLELPHKLQYKVLACAIRGGQPEELVAGAVADPRIMGYLKLYQILLDRSKAELAQALRLFTDPANLPVLVHCIHGKDRTGLVVMLLLMICRVDKTAIIKDYALSEELLKEGREKKHLEALQAYLTTDEVIASRGYVIQYTIAYLERKYVSGERYALNIGLSHREIAAIRRNLLRDCKGCKD